MVPMYKGKRVTFATYMLKEACVYMVANNIPLSWEHFQVAFFDMYFPKEQEFLHLKHERMLVAKFTKKFEQLANPHKLN
jgi:hypothetical protein